MKIAILQFAPDLGKIQQNIERAERLLDDADMELDGLNLLVLPEMALTGYNHPSLQAITPFLEPTAAGISSRWARKTARRLGCAVCIGYPETEVQVTSLTPGLPPSPANAKERNKAADAVATTETTEATSAQPADGEEDDPLSTNNAEELSKAGAEPIPSHAVHERTDGPPNYNSSVLVSRTGEVLAHYRKTFLYYTDTTWARPGSGFFQGKLTLPMPLLHGKINSDGDDGRVHNNGNTDQNPNAELETQAQLETETDKGAQTAMGICMDLNPHRFISPYPLKEFARHIISSSASLVLINMAWSSHDLLPSDVLPLNHDGSLNPEASMPYLETLSYWIERLSPVVEGQKEVVVVFANRCGVEEGGMGGKGETVYAGTSAVVLLGRGSVKLWGVLGQGEEGVLKVDTCEEPGFVLRRRGGEGGG